jgi:hypothetical protein
MNGCCRGEAWIVAQGWLPGVRSAAADHRRSK